MLIPTSCRFHTVMTRIDFCKFRERWRRGELRHIVECEPGVQVDEAPCGRRYWRRCARAITHRRMAHRNWWCCAAVGRRYLRFCSGNPSTNVFESGVRAELSHKKKLHITMAAFRTGGAGGVTSRCGGNGGATLPLLLFRLRSFDSSRLLALPLLAIPGYMVHK